MTHHLLKLSAIALILVIVVGLTCAGSVPQSLPASDIAGLSSPDMLRLTEALRVLTTHADTVWPGWKQTPPLLLRSGEYDYLIGHPAPPASFTPIPNVSINGLSVFRRSGHLAPVPAATTWQVTNQWSVAVPIRDEFQRAIDAALGSGVVDLDDIVQSSFYSHWPA